MSSAYIIEIDEETAGIVAAEKNGFRFYSSHTPYDSLEGVLFSTPRKAEAAARACRARIAPRRNRAPNLFAEGARH